MRAMRTSERLPLTYTYIESGGGRLLERSYLQTTFVFIPILNASAVFEQHANNVVVTVDIYLISRLLSNHSVAFVIF